MKYLIILITLMFISCTQESKVPDEPKIPDLDIFMNDCMSENGFIYNEDPCENLKTFYGSPNETEKCLNYISVNLQCLRFYLNKYAGMENK